jgi:hypothetical protein
MNTHLLALCKRMSLILRKLFAYTSKCPKGNTRALLLCRVCAVFGILLHPAACETDLDLRLICILCWLVGWMTSRNKMLIIM